MSYKIDPVITKGTVHGSCPKCGQPYMGEMDANETTIQMECVSCHYKKEYSYVWPDELPKVVMRNKKAQ